MTQAPHPTLARGPRWSVDGVVAAVVSAVVGAVSASMAGLYAVLFVIGPIEARGSFATDEPYLEDPGFWSVWGSAVAGAAVSVAVVLAVVVAGWSAYRGRRTAAWGATGVVLALTGLVLSTVFGTFSFDG